MALLKTRKLYQVRHHPNNGLCSGRHVGYKARLLPRNVALRIAARLTRCGLFVTADPIAVRLTREEAGYLKVRYG